MKNINILTNITIKQAMKKLSNTSQKCLIVVNKENKLLGTITDGDLRRALLKGNKLTNFISSIYNKKPIYVNHKNISYEYVKKILTVNKINLVPVVDNKKNVLNYITLENIITTHKKKTIKKLDIPVVIMAGGKGTRLEPFTKILPKPLIPIKNKPIIQHIIDNFYSFGLKNFYLTVNYKSLILKAFFAESKMKYKVNFVEESKPLGTAGSLLLLKNKIKKSFIVTNCDTLIDIDINMLYKFHLKNKFDLTLVASTKEVTIPYGKCIINNEGNLDYIDEKPKLNYLVNTGMYIINPKILDIIPKDKIYHITDLIKDIKKEGKQVGIYPIEEKSWNDVGVWNEYFKVEKNFDK